VSTSAAHVVCVVVTRVRREPLDQEHHHSEHFIPSRLIRDKDTVSEADFAQGTAKLLA
jgi:hypothetical protein